MPVYYRNKQTGKIEGKYVGCDTKSTKFRDETRYERFESPEDLPLEILRQRRGIRLRKIKEVKK